jgi:hypothetical protein
MFKRRFSKIGAVLGVIYLVWVVIKVSPFSPCPVGEECWELLDPGLATLPWSIMFIDSFNGKWLKAFFYLAAVGNTLILYVISMIISDRIMKLKKRKDSIAL